MKSGKFKLFFLILLIFDNYFFEGAAICQAQYPKYVPINPYSRQIQSIDSDGFCFSFDDEQSLNDWVSLSNVELSWQKDVIDPSDNTKINCLKMSATGFDPYFASPQLDKPSSELGKPLKGKIQIILRMRRSEKGTGQIFWSERNAQGWNEERSVSFPIIVSENFENYKVFIETESELQQIRLDIGSYEGTAEISQLLLNQVHFLPIEISGYQVKDDQLELQLTNHNELPSHWRINVQKEMPVASTKEQIAVQRAVEDEQTEIIEKSQMIDIDAKETVSFQTKFPKCKPFEKITVSVVDQDSVSEAQSQNQIIRTFYAFHPELETDWITLKNESIEIQFAADGSGARIFQNKILTATIYPLIELYSVRNSLSSAEKFVDWIDEGNETAYYDCLSSTELDDLVESPKIKMLSLDARTTNRLHINEINSTNDQAICFEFQWKNSMTNQRFRGGQMEFKLNGNELQFNIESVLLACSPNLRVLGTMKQALLSGVEYLEEGEFSSSTADIETNEHRRFFPDPLTITMPLMSVITDCGSVSMLYDNLFHQALFASPNFIDGQLNEHRMGLLGGKYMNIAFGEESENKKGLAQTKIARYSGSFYQEKLDLSETSDYKSGFFNLKGIIRICPSEPLENVILWAVQKRGLPDLPSRPRTAEEQDALNLFGLTESEGRAENGAWFHAILPGASKTPFKPLFGSDFVSTIWELTGVMPKIAKLDRGGGHIRNYASFLLTNRGDQLLQWINSEAEQIRKNQASDGSFLYSGPFLKGHWSQTASGHCGNSLFRLLDHWRLTGNLESLNAALKGLEFVNRLKTPRGAQVWELSLHTPDIMGASRCCLANVIAFEATGKTEYLEQARRWAITGLPFVYQWNAFAPDQGKSNADTQNDQAVKNDSLNQKDRTFDNIPIAEQKNRLNDKTDNIQNNDEKSATENGSPKLMLYATTPVFGATNWSKPNWIGLPVQWCGLDYAYALLLLTQAENKIAKKIESDHFVKTDNIESKHNESESQDSPSEMPDWRKIAEGIIISAEQQQYFEGSNKGLFPDSFSLKEQNRHPFDINPTALHFLRRLLENRFTNIAILVDSESQHRILSPFPARIEGNEIVIEGKKGMTYQIIIDGKTVLTVESQGMDRIPL